MTSLFHPRQRAEELAALVDGSTPLREATSPATERLVGVVQLLRTAGDEPGSLPRDAFAAELRELLMTEAATVLTRENAGLALPARPRGTRERRLVAVATAAVLVGGTAGMATAAQSALPGQALYPVKRGIEKAQTELSLSTAGRGRELLKQADDRLLEAQALLAEDSATDTPRVPATLEDFVGSAGQGADLLLASYQDSRDPATVAAVRSFAAAALDRVSAISSTAPPEAQPGLRDAALALRRIDARARGLCDACSDLPTLAVPRLFLTSAEVERAMARFQVAQPDNSHPVVASKQDVHRAVTRKPSGSSTASASGASPSTQATPAAPKAPVTPQAPTSGVAVPTVPTLPAVPTTPKLPSATDLGVTGLTDGLGDTVETLLPDPSTDGLLP